MTLPAGPRIAVLATWSFTSSIKCILDDNATRLLSFY